MVACEAGNLNTVKFLINKNANVNSQTANHKHTPLSLACNGGYFEIVKILLEYNANPFNILNNNSNMIIEAASGGNTDVMELICSLMVIIDNSVLFIITFKVMHNLNDIIFI